MDGQGKRPDYSEAIERSAILTFLAPSAPRVVGTPPLGLAMPDSDIDIVCEAADPERFVAVLWDALSSLPDFSMRQWTGDGRPIIASFRAHGWLFEIFAAATPVEEQAAWRHFVVERRLLDLGEEVFWQAVMDRRRAGAKTEPAFAAALGLAGDPYITLLDLHDASDERMAKLLADAGFGDIAVHHGRC